MRGKTPSPNNTTTSGPVVPLPDLLAQKPVGVSHPEAQEILADEVVNAAHPATLESTASTKKLKTKLPSCLTEPEESSEERKSAVLAAAKPNEDDLMELLLSKKSKVQATQRSASLDEGGGVEGKSRLERTESTPSVGSSSDVRTEKAMSKGEKPSEKSSIPGEKVEAKKTGGKGEKVENTSKTMERQLSKVSDSFSKALGESDKMVSKKKAKKEKKNDVNEKHKKGTKERVYIDTEKARTSNPRHEVDPVKTASEKSQKQNKVEKHKEYIENTFKGQKSSKGSLLADNETVAKETDTGSVGTGEETPMEDDEDDIGSDNIACQYCFVMFKFDNLQGHIEKCEKKHESSEAAEILAGQVEAIEGGGASQNAELNSRKGEPVVHSDDEPADEFGREGREKEERERCLKETEMRAKEEKDMREKEMLEREVKENEEKERKKKERKEKEDEKEKKKKGEKEMKRKEKKKKESERERKESEEENDKKKSNQDEKDKNEKQGKEASQQQVEIEEMVGSKAEKARTEVFQEKVKTGIGFGKTQDNKETEREMEGSDAPGIVTPQEKTPQGESSEDKEAQLTEGGTKRKGEGVPQRKGQTKRRRMARGQVMSLHRALGGGTSSEEEDEVDEEPLSIWKGGRKPQSVFFLAV